MRTPAAQSKVLAAALLLALSVAARFPCLSFADAAPAVGAVVLVPDKTDIAAGENVVIRGTVTLPSGSTLSLLGSERDKDAVPDKDGKEPEQPFSIIKLDNGQPTKLGGQDEIPVAITAAAFELGEVTFPALDWLINTGETQTLKSAPIKFKVAAPQAQAPDADIKDLKGPVRPFNWPLFWGFWAIVVLLAAAAGLWAWYGGKESEEEDGEDVHALPPYEEALDRIKQLTESGLWESGASKEFFSQLADIQRDYLSRRFAIEAKLMTTAALARQMRQLEIDNSLCRSTRDLLETCDMVKFAKWIPEAGDKDDALARAREILEATKPKEEPKPDAARANGSAAKQ